MITINLVKKLIPYGIIALMMFYIYMSHHQLVSCRKLLAASDKIRMIQNEAIIQNAIKEKAAHDKVKKAHTEAASYQKESDKKIKNLRGKEVPDTCEGAAEWAVDNLS